MDRYVVDVSAPSGAVPRRVVADQGGTEVSAVNEEVDGWPPACPTPTTRAGDALDAMREAEELASVGMLASVRR